MKIPLVGLAPAERGRILIVDGGVLYSPTFSLGYRSNRVFSDGASFLLRKKRLLVLGNLSYSYLKVLAFYYPF